MKKSILIVIAIAATALAAAAWFYLTNMAGRGTQNYPDGTAVQNYPARPIKNIATSTIDTFEKCLAAGHPVVGEAPHRMCKVSDTLGYIEIETCAAANGRTMNIYEAQRAFASSQCGLEGSPESGQCDEKAGTWRFPMLAYKKGCRNPVCVIDAATGKANIEWDCSEVPQS